MIRSLVVMLALGLASGAALASNNVAVAAGPTAKASLAQFITLSAQENQDPGCIRTIINGRIRVTADTDNGGGQENFAINAWDDGNFRAGINFSVPVGATAVYDFQFVYNFPILTVSTGVGVSIEDAVGPAATKTWALVSNLTGPTTTSCPPGQSLLTLISRSSGAAPVPALGPVALGLLAALLGVLGIRVRRRRA